MNTLKFAVVVLTVIVQSAFAGELPNQQLTPGAINPSVTQSNIHQTICVAGWTKTIRPSTSYTNRVKRASMAAYGIPAADIDKIELDHLLSLEVGGAPFDPKNLWPEYWYLNVNGLDEGAHQKDKAETATNRAVCDGRITLIEAQKQLMTDWRVLYYRFVAKEFPKFIQK
jgi:hypothetical protein